ncbi:MAG: thioredoxin [Halieaceae bacterium]|nr:thioredoxin [Halieaceae bacterium]
MTDYIVNIDESNAMRFLIEESNVRPVVVDFWADWCGPCKTLMPILEKLAHEYAGAFLLAKVNADEQQNIAGQFGVRSLPTVMVIQNGQPVDGFAGAQSEAQVRELLQKYLPSPWAAALEEAARLMEVGDQQAALTLLRKAYDDSDQDLDIALNLAHVLIQCNRFAEAETVLENIRFVDRDARYEQLVAELALKQEASKSPETEALEAKLEADPDNLDLRVDLAVQYSVDGHYADALEQLMVVLKTNRDHNNGGTKKRMLDIIASLGKGDPIAVDYQRKLFGLLY